jgi:hypothetical protein
VLRREQTKPGLFKGLEGHTDQLQANVDKMRMQLLSQLDQIRNNQKVNATGFSPKTRPWVSRARLHLATRST